MQNRKHRPQASEMMIKLAKRYAKAQGHGGLLGGWIYAPPGRILAHGWSEYWHTRSQQIIHWAEQQGLIDPGQDLRINVRLKRQKRTSTD